ncbi:hypothetical protein EMCRGX_G024291 [Ephydatia muelleri]
MRWHRNGHGYSKTTQLETQSHLSMERANLIQTLPSLPCPVSALLNAALVLRVGVQVPSNMASTTFLLNGCGSTLQDV